MVQPPPEVVLETLFSNTGLRACSAECIAKIKTRKKHHKDSAQRISFLIAKKYIFQSHIPSVNENTFL